MQVQSSGWKDSLKSRSWEVLAGYSPLGRRTRHNCARVHNNSQCQLGLSWASGVTATLQQAAGLRHTWVQTWGEGRCGGPHWRLWREPKRWAPERRCRWAAGLLGCPNAHLHVPSWMEAREKACLTVNSKSASLIDHCNSLSNFSGYFSSGSMRPFLLTVGQLFIYLIKLSWLNTSVCVRVCVCALSICNAHGVRRFWLKLRCSASWAGSA